MIQLLNTPLHKNQVEEQRHYTCKTTTKPDGFSPSEHVPPEDDDASISKCNKTPLCSSSSSSESKKNDSSGKRKSTDGEEDSINNKKMKTTLPTPTPSSPSPSPPPQSPTTGINNDSSSFIKMLGPLHLPDFKNRHEINLHLLRLKSELASTNSQLEQPHSNTTHNLTKRRQHIISDLIRENPTFNNLQNQTTQSKLCKKIYIPVQKYPNYNFIGPIIGPRGQTQKRMQRETGAKINVRGRGASRSQQHEHIHPDSSDDLHVYIEAETQDSLESATAMVEKLLLLPQQQQQQQPEEPPEDDQNVERTKNKKEKKKKEKSVMETSSIYVANLPQGVEEAELQRIFSCYGEINSTRVMRDRCTGCSRGYGFVNFESSEGAAMAVKMSNGTSMGGKVMVVRMAEVKNSVFQEKKGMAATPQQQQLSLSPQGMVFQSRMFVPFPQGCSRKGPCWYYENNYGSGNASSSFPNYHHHRVHHILPYPFYAAPVNPPFPFSSNY